MSSKKKYGSWDGANAPEEAPEEAAETVEEPVTVPEPEPVVEAAAEPEPEPVVESDINVSVSASGVTVTVPLSTGDRIAISALEAALHKAKCKAGAVARVLMAKGGVKVTSPGVIEFVPAEGVVFTNEVSLEQKDVQALDGAVSATLKEVG